MIEDRLAEMKETFASFNDLDDKWKYLISLAKSHMPMSSEYKKEDYIVEGCSTTMYLVPRCDGHTMHFELGVEVSGSQPLISLGLGVLALKIYNDVTPKEILSVDRDFFKTIGLNVGLTPTRNNGFASILDRIYKSATVYSMIYDKKPE